MAEEHKITIGGSLIEQDKDAYYNTFVLYDQSGETINSYRKVHLFRMLNEEQYFKAGDRLVIAETEWGKIGMATCYDLRFPEMFRAYSVKGVVLILVIAEWAQRRIAHWQQLLQARAIENQCFVIAPNQSGVGTDSVVTFGNSMVVDPWGKILARAAKEGEEVIYADLYFDELDEMD